MTYRNHTQRCPHGFALFIRCEQCAGRWKGQQPEPKEVGHRGLIVTRYGRRRGDSQQKAPASYRKAT